MADPETPLADQVIAALAAGHDDLAALVAGLSPDQLTSPSAASEWDLSQVISHLGSGAVIGRAVLDAALAGEPVPGMDLNHGVWDRWNAMSPTDRAAQFPAANRSLVERYTGLDPATRAGQRIDLGFLPQPVDVATAGRFRLNEFTLHSWDIRVALDPDAVLSPDAVPLLLDHATSLLGWIAKADQLAGRPLTLRVDLTDPDLSFGLSIADSVSQTAIPDAPDGTLALPAEAWLRLATGRLAPRHTPSSVSVSGIELDALRPVFPGF